MSNQPRRRPQSQAKQGAQRFGDRVARPGPRRPSPPPRRQPWLQRNRGPVLGAIGLVIVVVAAIIFALKARSGGGSPTVAATQPAAASVVAAVTRIPQATYDAVGLGSANATLKGINAPALVSNGKPEVLYVGGQFCPFCAAERWSLVAALSRFGAFSGLNTTRSSSSDVYPSTATFSFDGSTYSSQYLAFTPVEEFSNQPSTSGGYTILQPLTSDQQKLVATYDAPPYLTSAGSIPFVDFGGKYALQGATYSPGVLANQDWNQIAAKLSQPSSAVAKGIIGSANLLTAALCTLTNQQPATVCQARGTTEAAAKLGGQ
jgi:hypothetical protein